MASMFTPKMPTPQPLPEVKMPELPAPRVMRMPTEDPVSAGIRALSSARNRTGRRSTILTGDGGNSMGSSGKTLGA
jgi:hypothetical protein